MIELLVVILIIAVLAAIILPVLTNAKEMAKRSACIAQLYEWNKSCAMYISDYDDYYPRSVSSLNSSDGSITFGLNQQLVNTYDMLEPYMKSSALAVCPSDQRPVPWSQILLGAGFFSYTSPEVGSYSPNTSVFTAPLICAEPNQCTPPVDPSNEFVVHMNVPVRNDSALLWPSLTTEFYDTKYVMLYGSNPDAAAVNIDGVVYPIGVNDPNSSAFQYANPNIAFGIGQFPGAKRHSGGVSVAFIDGHAKWIGGSFTLPGCAQDPNYDGDGAPCSDETGVGLRVYRPPFDFNGIPGVEADP